MEGKKTKIERKRVNPIKKWSSTEEINLLMYMEDELQNDCKPEQPTARMYYDKIIKKAGLKDVDHVQAKNKVGHMKKKYMIARNWSNQSGEGVDDGSIKGHLNKLCPHYELLDKIYSTKVNVVIPFVFDSLMSSEIQANVVQNSRQLPITNDRNTEVDTVSLIVVRQTEPGEIAVENLNVDMRDDVVLCEQEIITEPPEQILIDDDIVRLCSTTISQTSSLGASQNNVDAVNLNNVATGNPYNVATGNSNNVATGNPNNVAGNNQNEVPSATSTKDDDIELQVSRFKKALSTSVPCKKHKSIPSNASAFISDANSQRAEALKEKNEIEMIRVENERLARSATQKLDNERLAMEKEFRWNELETEKIKQDHLSDQNIIELKRVNNEIQAKLSENEISKERLALEKNFRLKEFKLQKTQQDNATKKNQVDLKRIDCEIEVKSNEQQLNEKRFLLEKEIRLQELEMQKLRDEREHTIEKMRLDYNYQIELAKINLQRSST